MLWHFRIFSIQWTKNHHGRTYEPTPFPLWNQAMMRSPVFLHFHLTSKMTYDYFPNSGGNIIKENSRYTTMANQPRLLKEVSPLDLTRMVDEGSTFLINIKININTDTSKEKKDESHGTGRLIRSSRNGDLDTFQWLCLIPWEIFSFQILAFTHLPRSTLYRLKHSQLLLSESTPTPSKKRIHLRTNKKVFKTFLRETLENFPGIMERIEIIPKVVAKRVASSNREMLLFLNPSRRNYRENKRVRFRLWFF